MTTDQRYILRHLIERDGHPRSEALFALGYWAGCRVSDVAWLRMEHTHVGPKVGWLHVGYKGGKTRDIDLVNAARRPLYEYMYHGGRDTDSAYTFTSQRSNRVTEAGIHRWWKNIKAHATVDEWEIIHDVTFHDLRHDFAHRSREAAWTLEEVAYYLGHITNKGTPAIQTTVRYTPHSALTTGTVDNFDAAGCIVALNKPNNIFHKQHRESEVSVFVPLLNWKLA